MHSYKVPDLLHYLDDFVTAGPPNSPQCAQNLSTSVAVCKRLGLPLHPGKCVGPTPVLTMLGIELDSLAQVACLPADKLQVLRDLIRSWLLHKWCFRWELESLIGHLHHAAKVVWPGRTFLHHMIDLLCCFRTKDYPIRLNQEFHRDLSWWHHFLDQWHGVSFWLFPGLSPATDLEVSSDAAGSLGFGAFFKGQWFYGLWALPQQSQSIAYKELFPVAIAAFVWGPQWCKRHVLFHPDNDAVVYMLISALQRSRVLCNFYATYCSQLPAIAFPFQPNVSLASTTNLLMLSLISLGRTSTC